MTGPREWRHAMGCHAINWSPNRVKATTSKPCTCGLSAVRDAIAAGHRVVIGPDGVEGRVVGYEHGTGRPVTQPLEEP